MVQANSEQRSSQIIKNVLVNWTAFGSTLLLGFVLSPFLVRNLGDSVYGVWVLLGSLVGYLGLLEFGLTPSIVKYIAEYRAREDQAAINRLVTCAFAVYSAMGLLSLVITFVVAFNFNNIFETTLSNNTVAAVAILSGVNLALSFPALVFVGIVRGYQRYDINSGITSITLIARSIFFVAAIVYDYGIIGLAVATLLFDVIRLAYLTRWAFKLNPEIQIARRYFQWRDLRRLFSYSVYVFLIILGERIIFFTDSIVIGLFLSTSSVTAYFIAGRLVSYLRSLVEEMIGVLAPVTSDLDARNNQKAISELLKVSTKYMLLLALPVATVFFVMGDSFISLWMGPEYAASAAMLTVLTIATVANLLLLPSNTVLQGMGRHSIVAWFTILQAVLNLVLSVVLVKRYGVMGVALGTAIPMVATSAAALVVYFRYYLKLGLGDYLRSAIPMPLLVQVPFVAALLLLKTYAPATSLMILFAQIAAAFVPYGCVAFLTCLSPRERRPFLLLAEKFGLKLSPMRT